MPQLDFYSYLSQLVIIIVISSFIYIFLIKILLPSIAITLKMREMIIEKREHTIKTVEASKKEDVELLNGITNSLTLFPEILLNLKEDTLVKEIIVLYHEGLESENIIDDIEEEFLSQIVRKIETNIEENTKHNV